MGCPMSNCATSWSTVAQPSWVSSSTWPRRSGTGGYHLGGAAWDADREYGMAVPADRAAADVLRDYRAAVEDSDRAIRVAGDPDARFAVPVEGNRHTLRWVMAHMTSETARHAGHADILREQLDG